MLIRGEIEYIVPREYMDAIDNRPVGRLLMIDGILHHYLWSSEPKESDTAIIVCAVPVVTITTMGIKSRRE